MAYTYFAQDGNFGDAEDLILIDTADFSDDDYDNLLNLSDMERMYEAQDIAAKYGAHMGEPTVLSVADLVQYDELFENAIKALITNEEGGLANELSDFRNRIFSNVRKQA